MKIRIYGASDDLIEVEGCKNADEFNSYERGPVMWRGDLRAPDGDVVRAYALFDGCWSIALGQVDEDRPLPDWDIQIVQEGRYSTAAQIDAPDGTVLENVWPAQGGDDD
jgi:hypothetical protein